MKLIKPLVLLAFLVGCTNINLPKERLYQFYTDAKVYFKNDTIYFSLNNPVKCPLRYYISSSDRSFDQYLNSFKPIILQTNEDTILKIAGDSALLKTITFPNFLGDLNQKIKKNKLDLPFPKRRSYRIIQGYNGSHSHNINSFNNAIDFDLKLNDTICAADDGLVVGVIKGYKYSGDDIRWSYHGNLITIYHPHSGLFTQYVHLVHNGSLVALGDSIVRGQPIGLSGKTGWTDVEHLHFCALVPVAPSDGLKSVKTEFTEGYKGEDLKRNDRVVKK